MGTIVTFTSNGGTDDGYLALPERGYGSGVIVIQEWWGLVDHIKDICERLAREGFVALAPDLYHGKTTREPDEAQKLMMGLNLEQAAKDMSGAIDYLRELSSVRGPGLGVIGFCMGGSLALMLALRRPDAVRAAVPFYGVLPAQLGTPDWQPLQAAILGHYAEHDDFASRSAVQEMVKQLQVLEKEIQVYEYPGTHHAFLNDTRPEVYNASAAHLAWQRTLTFLRQRLGS